MYVFRQAGRQRALSLSSLPLRECAKTNVKVSDVCLAGVLKQAGSWTAIRTIRPHRILYRFTTPCAKRQQKPSVVVRLGDVALYCLQGCLWLPAKVTEARREVSRPDSQFFDGTKNIRNHSSTVLMARSRGCCPSALMTLHAGAWYGASTFAWPKSARV